MDSRRWTMSFSAGVIVALLVTGCATEGESPTSSTEVSSQDPPSKTVEESNMLRDWARNLEAQEEETTREAESEPTEPTVTVAEIDAAYAFMGGIVLVEKAGEGDLGEVKSLLQSGVDVNAKDKAGTTALMAAASKGHVEICRVLLEAGANRGLKNKEGKSAADLAEAAGFEEVRALVKDAPD